MRYLKYLVIPFLAISLSLQVFAQSYSEQLHKFGRVLTLVNSLYVDTVNQESIVEEAIVAMLQELDPHSIYISKDEVKRMNEPLNGAFEGIGIQFNILDDTLMVVATISTGPSEKLGIMAGDRILTVDGENVAGVGLENSDVLKLLRGEKGSIVEVEILRRGENELLDFSIERDKIPIFSVNSGYIIDDEIGYVKLNRFAKTTDDELEEVFAEFELNNIEKIILDLSSNGGGYMDKAIWLADQFLTESEMIVYTEGVNNPKREYRASSKGHFEDAKVVVLVDESSASASEIVSGAIQDWDRGVIVGRRTFGKGLVQRPFPLPDESMIRLTVARYYTPSGRCIQKSYEDGVEDYATELLDRYEHGEFTNRDSIQFADSLMYITLRNERKVFGGGGIMPDVFIPFDTLAISDFHSKLMRKRLIFNFAIKYIDENRDELAEKYPDFNRFNKNFEVTDALLTKLEEMAIEEEIEISEEAPTDYQVRRLKIHLKSLIASDLWETNEFYQVNNAMNESVQKAIEILKNDAEYQRLLKKTE
ncbi:MAG: S41 family peptidase [Bacteroidota bacterium]|nr:S41 family peptidase [Bacteroidota bacterium]